MHPRLPARHSARRRSTAAGLAAVLAAGLTAVAVPGPAHAEDSGNGELTMVQANIKVAIADRRFRSDVREVMAVSPDFVSYNEVPYRDQEVLAPDGYSLHRTVRNKYTRATPVAWRHPEWTKLDAGSFRISNVREVPDGAHTRLGLRFATWATLRSVDGRTVSIVSAHVAPLFKIDGKEKDLIRPSVRRLGTLVDRLAESGPVLVGGDFNVHYRSHRYPADLFAEAGLVPTYDTMGSHFPTGDHRGATIDYLFVREAGQVRTVHQDRRELESDHDAVIGGFDWTTDAPGETTTVVSDPAGTVDERRAAIREMTQRIAGTSPGETVDVVTGRLSQRSLYRSVRDAVTRGVHVRLLTRANRLSVFERRFRRHVAEHDARSSLDRCRDACKDRWRDSAMRRTFGLVSNQDGVAALRLDANRNLNKLLPERRTKLVLRSGEVALTEGEQMLAHVR